MSKVYVVIKEEGCDWFDASYSLIKAFKTETAANTHAKELASVDRRYAEGYCVQEVETDDEL